MELLLFLVKATHLFKKKIILGVSFLGAAHSSAPQDGDGGALLIPIRISSLFLLWSSLGYHQHQLQFSSSLQSRPSRTHFHNIESNGYVLSFIFFVVSIVVGSLQDPSVVVVVVVVFSPPFVRR